MFLSKPFTPAPALNPQSRRQTYSIDNLQGIVEDIPPTQLPPEVISRGINVEVSDIGMRSSLGNTPAFGAPLYPPEHLTFTTKPGLFYWLYASGNGVGVTDGINHFDITPAEWLASVWPQVFWTDCNINDFPVLNSGKDQPYFWNLEASQVMQPLPGWPTANVAQSVRAYKKALIAMNVFDGAGDFSNLLLWSNSAEPGAVPDSWTPLPENDAGFNTLSDTRGALLDGQAFRDSFMLFKQHSTYLMNYVGGNFVYSFRKLFETTGILSQNCSAEYFGKVIALTDGDLIITDGQNAQSMIDKKMRRWLFNQIDPDNYSRAFIAHYHSQNQVWCCFPEQGADEATLALVWDGTDNKFGVRELVPSTPHIGRGQVGAVSGTITWEEDNEPWESDTTIWNQSLFNPTDDALLQAYRGTDTIAPVLYAVNEGTTYGGNLIHNYLERVGLDFGDIYRTKFIRGIILRVTGNEGIKLRVRVGASNNDSSVVQWAPEVLFTLGDSQYIPFQVSGRFIGFSVEALEDQAQWFLQGVEFAYDWRGRY